MNPPPPLTMSQVSNYKRSALTENFTADVDSDLSMAEERDAIDHTVVNFPDGFADG